MRRIVMHIDRLALRGLGRGDAPAVVAGLRSELQRLLAQPGAEAALVAQAGRATLRAGNAALPDGADAATLGRAVAGRIAGGGTP